MATVARDPEGGCQVRLYREIHRTHLAARIELWDAGAALPRQVDVFPFKSWPELVAFENWVDATILLVTGREVVERR